MTPALAEPVIPFSNAAVNEMGREQWYTDEYGHLLDTEHGLRLIVRQFDGCARYVIVRTAPEGDKYGDTMLASGTESDVNAAMTAARKTASRVEPILAKRPRL